MTLVVEIMRVAHPNEHQPFRSRPQLTVSERKRRSLFRIVKDKGTQVRKCVVALVMEWMTRVVVNCFEDLKKSNDEL